jgi:peroxiredoxin
MKDLAHRAGELAALAAVVTLAGCAKTQTRATGDAEVGSSGYVVSAIAAVPGALTVGDRAPNFELSSDRGGTVELNDLLDDGPVVLTFYRGEWCPYCNQSLAELQEALPQIKELGAQIVAISPQTIASSSSTRGKGGLDYVVLSDPGNRVASEFGVAFQLPDQLLSRYKNSFNIDLSEYNDDADTSLPLRTLYVIDQDREIRYAFVTDDHSKKARARDVIDTLHGI